MNIQVLVEIGHRAQVRSKPTVEGFTHDWTIFVKGHARNEISHFVEKVVFHLHESFAKATRVIKSPPYEVSESGYGGFEVLIEIYFRNKLEPRKVQFSYDLWLPLDNPEPVVSQRVEKLTFLDPADDFAEKLFKAGGILNSGAHETHVVHSANSSKVKPLAHDSKPLSMHDGGKFSSHEGKQSSSHDSRTSSHDVKTNLSHMSSKPIAAQHHSQNSKSSSSSSSKTQAVTATNQVTSKSRHGSGSGSTHSKPPTTLSLSSAAASKPSIEHPVTPESRQFTELFGQPITKSDVIVKSKEKKKLPVAVVLPSTGSQNISNMASANNTLPNSVVVVDQSEKDMQKQKRLLEASLFPEEQSPPSKKAKSSDKEKHLDVSKPKSSRDEKHDSSHHKKHKSKHHSSHRDSSGNTVSHSLTPHKESGNRSSVETAVPNYSGGMSGRDSNSSSTSTSHKDTKSLQSSSSERPAKPTSASVTSRARVKEDNNDRKHHSKHHKVHHQSSSSSKHRTDKHGSVDSKSQITSESKSPSVGGANSRVPALHLKVSDVKQELQSNSSVLNPDTRQLSDGKKNVKQPSSYMSKLFGSSSSSSSSGSSSSSSDDDEWADSRTVGRSQTDKSVKQSAPVKQPPKGSLDRPAVKSKSNSNDKLQQSNLSSRLKADIKASPSSLHSSDGKSLLLEKKAEAANIIKSSPSTVVKTEKLSPTVYQSGSSRLTGTNVESRVANKELKIKHEETVSQVSNNEQLGRRPSSDNDSQSSSSESDDDDHGDSNGDESSEVDVDSPAANNSSGENEDSDSDSADSSSEVNDRPVHLTANLGNDANGVRAPNGELVSVLLDIQNKLMQSMTDERLDYITTLIEETGKYAITDETFDFDLCLLDSQTVAKIKQFVESLT